MSSKRLHFDSALKWKIIVYAEKHGNRAMKQVSVAEGMTAIPYFIVKQQQNALYRPSEGKILTSK